MANQNLFTGENLEILIRELADPISGVEVGDRKYRFRTYKQCFVGSSAVTWIAVHRNIDRITALNLGQSLMDLGYLLHVTGEHNMEDKKLFYRFTKKVPSLASTNTSTIQEKFEKERTATIPTVVDKGGEELESCFHCFPMAEIQNRLGPVKNSPLPVGMVPSGRRPTANPSFSNLGPQKVSRISIIDRSARNTGNKHDFEFQNELSNSATEIPTNNDSNNNSPLNEFRMNNDLNISLGDSMLSEKPSPIVNAPIQQIVDLTNELKGVIGQNRPALKPSVQSSTNAKPTATTTTTLKPQLKQGMLKPVGKTGEALKPQGKVGKPTTGLKHATPFSIAQENSSTGAVPKELPVQLGVAPKKFVEMPKNLIKPTLVKPDDPHAIKLSHLETGDSWHVQGTSQYFDCRKVQCHAGLINPRNDPQEEARLESKEVVLKEALQFLEEYNRENGINLQAAQTRIQQVKQSIQNTGTYRHTLQELTFGARTAWRNSGRCIGRLVWSKLQVLDRRDCLEPEQIYEALINHLKFATNSGNIITTISIFPQKEVGKPGYRIWNSQLIRYAGYTDPNDQSIIGDPSEVEMTKWAKAFGWSSPQTSFDILPLLIQKPGKEPRLFHLPDESVLEVPISHPTYSWFQEFGYRWYALPSVSNMSLRIGGITYTCAPFSSWYMLNEVVRNLSDVHRYNQLPAIAQELNLDLSSRNSLWKDQSVLELTRAILHSFNKHQVAMVDHQTAADSFFVHFKNEMETRGEIPCDVRFLIPSLSSCTSSLFNLEMINYQKFPCFSHMEPAWKGVDLERRKRLTTQAATNRITQMLSQNSTNSKKHLILFASQSYKARGFAERLEGTLTNKVSVELWNMAEFDPKNLTQFQTVIVFAASYSNGQPPHGCLSFKKFLEEQVQAKTRLLEGINFAVFGLGSRVYPDYCEFPRFVDATFLKLGAKQILIRGEADEVAGQEKTFLAWKNLLKYEILTDLKSIKEDAASEKGAPLISQYKAVTLSSSPPPSSNSQSNDKELTAKIHSQTELLSEKANRSTKLVILDVPSTVSVDYEPGDYLAVLPENDGKLVAQMLKFLKVSNPSQLVQMERLRPISGNLKTLRFPPCTIAQALLKYVDLTSRPTPYFLSTLSNYTNDQKEKTELIGMATGGGAYRDWIKISGPTLIDVFSKYPTVQLSWDIFLEIAPLTHPRFYSIAGTRGKNGNQLHLVVSVISYYSISQEVRYGLCSSFLTKSPLGTEVKCWIHKNPFFKMPSDSSPLIMISAGTGISNFKSFWQSRAEALSQGKGNELGPAVLVYGCRDPDNQLFFKEIGNAIDESALTSVFTAYSRFGTKRQYVQNIIEKETAFATLLLEHNAYLYVCGDVELAKGVQSALTFLLESQGLEKRQAVEFLELLRKENRYQESFYGLLFNFNEKSENFAELYQRQPLTALLKAEKRDTVNLAANF